MLYLFTVHLLFWQQMSNWLFGRYRTLRASPLNPQITRINDLNGGRWRRGLCDGEADMLFPNSRPPPQTPDDYGTLGFLSMAGCFQAFCSTLCNNQSPIHWKRWKRSDVLVYGAQTVSFKSWTHILFLESTGFNGYRYQLNGHPNAPLW